MMNYINVEVLSLPVQRLTKKLNANILLYNIDEKTL